MISVAICLALGMQDNSLNAILTRVANPLDGDRKLIAKFGDAAFIKLYPQVQKSLQNPPKEGAKYYILRTQLEYLSECASESRTREMIALYQTPFDLSQQYLIAWLSQKGNAKQSRSVFENALKSGKQYDPASACQGLMRIADPSALDLVGKTVLDPDVESGTRAIACRLLAKSEKPQALAFVRKALHGSTTLPELAKRRNLPTLTSKDVLSRNVGKDGFERALIKWDALGGPDDLWIVAKKDGRWQDPLFTGVSTYWPVGQMGPAKGYEEHQAKMKVLIEEKAWVERFGPTSQIAKDSDGDGYTDIVEEWLGLNLHKADTDGDGIADGIDRNPFFSNKSTTDSSKAVKAALESFAFTQSWFNSNAILEFQNGISPVALSSGAGLVLQWPAEQNARIGRLYGKWFSVTGVEAVKSNQNEFEVRVMEAGGFYQMLWLARVKQIGQEWFCINARVLGSSVS